jgi:hypothetical protein
MSKAKAPSALLTMIVAAAVLLVVEIAAFCGAAELLAHLTPTSRYATRDSGPVGPDLFGAYPLLFVTLAVLLAAALLGVLAGRRHRRRGGVMIAASALFGLGTFSIFGAMGLFSATGALGGTGPVDGAKLAGTLMFYAVLVLIPLVVALSGLSIGGLLAGGPRQRPGELASRPG